LTLDDLDWQRGEIVVRGMGSRQDRLPMPRDVGAAVVDYLRHMRPASQTRLNKAAPWQKVQSRHRPRSASARPAQDSQSIEIQATEEKAKEMIHG